MTAYDQLLAEGAALRDLLKGQRLTAGHPVLADLQALHDHQETPDHVRHALRGLMEKHGRPRGSVDPAHVARHVEQIRSATPGTRAHQVALDAVMVRSAGHVHAVTRALHGKQGRNKGESGSILGRSHHDAIATSGGGRLDLSKLRGS